MAGERAISQKVRAANGRLAALLRRREDDDAILQIGRSRIKELAAKEAKSPAKGGRVAMPSADFAIPLPRSGRPRAADGITTAFHFEMKHVTKSDPTGSEKTGLAVEHAIYVERTDAVETGPAAKHAGYLERQEAVEMAERPLVFSNISTDAGERRDYWRAVERCERTPHPGLDINPANRDGWWKDAALDLPWDFLTHCEAYQFQRAAYRGSLEALSSSYEPQRFYADREKCDRIIAVLKRTPGWSDEEPPVTLRPGLGGRTQYRFVAELPYELSQGDRIRIVDDFCAYLGSFARNQEGEEVGMMYTAVIHAPGPDNHNRNYHLHVIAHDRPASWLPSEGQWDFEYSEKFEHRGEIRIRYPHRQDKIPEVTRRLAPEKRSPFYNDKIAGKAFVPHLREKFATVCNERLAYRSIERRVDARSHMALGIDKAPEVHLGTRASSLERIGVSTLAGRFNQASSWRYQEERDNLAAKHEIDELRQSPIHSARPRADYLDSYNLKQEQAASLNDIEELTRLSKEHSRLIEQALSRAQMVRENCLRELKKRHSAKVRRDLEARLEEASQHIRSVREIIRQAEPDLRSAATERGELILRHYQIDLRLTEIAKLQKRLVQSARLDFSSVASPAGPAEALHAVDGLASIGGLRSIGMIEKGANGVLTLDQITAAAAPKPEQHREEQLSETIGLSPHVVAPATTQGSVQPAYVVETLGLPVRESQQPHTASQSDQLKGAPEALGADLTTLRSKESKISSEAAPLSRKAEIDNLLDRIARERIEVSHKSGKLFVEKLSEYDTALLNDKAMSTLIKKRLSGIVQIQRHEIDRLISAVQQYGSDLSEHYIPSSVRTLRSHWGDHPDVLKASNTNKASIGSQVSNTLYPSLSAKVSLEKVKTRQHHGVDIAREHARLRATNESLVASRARMETAGKSIDTTDEVDMTSNPRGIDCSALSRAQEAGSPDVGLPSKLGKSVGFCSKARAILPTRGMGDHLDSVAAPIQLEDHFDLNWLLTRLEVRTLPLREAIIVEGGQARTVITIVVEKAVPEDVSLVAMAARHQSAAIIQELLRRQFDQLLAHVRSSLIAEPNASDDRKRVLLNPKNGLRLGAALAAAEGSPSFTAIIEPDRGIAADSERNGIKQTSNRGR